VIGWNRFGDEIYLFRHRPAERFAVPGSGLDDGPGAAAMAVRESPRVDLGALRDLRRLLDATRLSPTLDLRPTGETTMKQTPTLQRNLFNAPTTKAEARLPQNIQMEPLKSLVQISLGQARKTETPGCGSMTESTEVIVGPGAGQGVVQAETGLQRRDGRRGVAVFGKP
jgi:hypothetical protein